MPDRPERGRTTKPSSDANMNIRLPLETRWLIDVAASTLGKTGTQFVLDSAREHAKNVLLDQRLRRLVRHDAPWKQENSRVQAASSSGFRVDPVANRPCRMLGP